MLGIEGAVGLSTVLIGRADVADVVQDWGTTGLQVLASGPVPPNSSELLNSPQMRRLLDQLRQRYDYVVLDAAPVLPVADATILSHSVDGTIVVANVTKVRRHQLTQTLSSLEQVGARLLGIVLNQVDRKGPSYTYQPHDGELAWEADATPPRPKSPDQGSLAGDGATQQQSEVIVEQPVTPPVGTAPSAASATQVPNRERGWALRQGEDEQ
jgi:Mrp family chromosome partitioning ATPase